MKLPLATLALLLSGCASTPENDEKWRAVMGGLAMGAAAYNTGYNSGQLAPQYRPAAAPDYQWHWDQFYNQGYQLVWACRGAQTGEFAEIWRCNGQAQVDWKWPQK